MRRAARVVRIASLLALATAGLLPVGAGAGSEQGPAARVVLVSPANGALIQRSHLTFVWRVEWPRPPASGAVQVIHRYASDRAMTRQVSTTTRTCPTTDVNCWTSHRPSETFFGRYYWQVTLAGAVQATSTTHLLSVTGPRDELDRTRPTVRALGGTATRGRRALFGARVKDNSGEARLDAQLTYRGVPVVEGKAGFMPVTWGARRGIRSTRPLSRRLTPGVHRLCITAWDRAGNRGQSCARYRVR
jgi:hypothetical protein